MMKIEIVEKPQMGKRQRLCKACAEPYYGWNMYICAECENAGGIEIQELW